MKSLFRQYRIAVDQEPENEEAVVNLSSLIGAVASNASAITDRKHQSIVSDILSVKLWLAPHVSMQRPARASCGTPWRHKRA